VRQARHELLVQQLAPIGDLDVGERRIEGLLEEPLDVAQVRRHHALLHALPRRVLGEEVVDANPAGAVDAADAAARAEGGRGGRALVDAGGGAQRDGGEQLDARRSGDAGFAVGGRGAPHAPVFVLGVFVFVRARVRARARVLGGGARALPRRARSRPSLPPLPHRNRRRRRRRRHRTLQHLHLDRRACLRRRRRRSEAQRPAGRGVDGDRGNPGNSRRAHGHDHYTDAR
jgi:hypothetical protein